MPTVSGDTRLTVTAKKPGFQVDWQSQQAGRFVRRFDTEADARLLYEEIIVLNTCLWAGLTEDRENPRGYRVVAYKTGPGMPDFVRELIAIRATQNEARRHFEAGGAVVVSERGHEPTFAVGRSSTTHSRESTSWDELVEQVRMWRNRYPYQRFYVVPKVSEDK